jgi:hypothetical protein
MKNALFQFRKTNIVVVFCLTALLVASFAASRTVTAHPASLACQPITIIPASLSAGTEGDTTWKVICVRSKMRAKIPPNVAGKRRGGSHAAIGRSPAADCARDETLS